ncbi:MAG: mannose-6-phosphate isomerase, class I [Actinobacteria bacterium]|uniref:mannose-6-phosphate isomerase n=1 Tax=freshwater metagenome TaxID=449393 RepID=A0A6J7EWW3_9ZZZZ|nr:mannose-6-phosphate isomerase, class I [Actinomycetota bacterium]
MASIVRGSVKDYDWGIVDGLAAWCGGPTGRPQAELWFGVHPASPSPVVDEHRNPTGGHLADLYGVDQVPLLVKLLAAAQPLSVQVHPRAALAAQSWLAQQEPGSQQILADSYEKTELIVALEPFEAFVGWRSLPKTIEILADVPAAAAAVEYLRAGQVIAAIRALLAMEDVDSAVRLLPAAVRAAGMPADECAAYDMVVSTYPGDRGALLTAMLQYVALETGSAIYVPAGVPHSYIRGLGLEVMTTSDNVLRLGLTAKPMFIDEALDALDLTAEPQVMTLNVGDAITPAGAPFAVTLLDGRAGEQSPERIESGRYRLVLSIEGSTSVRFADDEPAHAVVLDPGSAAVLAVDEPALLVSTTGLAALVEDRNITS